MQHRDYQECINIFSLEKDFEKVLIGVVISGEYLQTSSLNDCKCDGFSKASLILISQSST